MTDMEKILYFMTYFKDEFMQVVDVFAGDGKSKNAGDEERFISESFTYHLKKMLRHQNKYLLGEKADTDSGKHPLAHAILRQMMLMREDKNKVEG